MTPIDTSNNTPGAMIAVGTDPQGIAVRPDGKTAYVANNGSDNVTPIDTSNNTPGAVIPVGNNPQGIAITPDQAPVAALTVKPAPGGHATAFDASGSTVRFGQISTYAWSFGDGTTTTTTVPTVSHVYAKAGSYTATVTETDSAGTSTTVVFTGQTVSRNGGPSATATVMVEVRGTCNGRVPTSWAPRATTSSPAPAATT